MNRRQLKVLYSGRVQGVGFRYSVKSQATGFEVTGTIRNLPDGRVELIAEGAKDELDEFAAAIRESELKHFIADEDVTWNDASGGFKSFSIAS